MKDIELDNLEKLIPSLANGSKKKIKDVALYIKVDINKKIILG